MPAETSSDDLNNSKMNRRHFIQQGTIISGGIMISPVWSRAEQVSQSVIGEPVFWYQKPLRIMHTVLREIDATNYDASSVVQYLKKDGCNVLCVNAGGIVDFFQNPLEGGNINSFMGKRDILKEISAACQDAGIKVIARVDFRGVEERIYRQFPDWFMKDSAQNPVIPTWNKPALYASCYLGYHRNEYANAFIAYVLKNYAVDGIWHNAPGVEGICYCMRCQQAYKAFGGNALPVDDSSSERELDQYMAWKTQVADQYMDRIKKTVKSFGQDKVYTAEIFSIYSVNQQADTGIDVINARNHFDILVSVAFLTSNSQGYNFPYENLNYGNTIIKFLKSMSPEREAVAMYGGNGTSHRMVIDPPVDLKIWLWEVLSAGGRFWNCYFSNVPSLTYDNRNAYNESEAYHFVKTNEKILERHVPVANIGIYYSRSTRLSYRKKLLENDRFGDEIRGVETVLMENHIPHDFILDDQVSREKLQKYKLVILPNTRCMSEREMETLKNYVWEGGKLMATYASSLYDEKGNERGDFGLTELFGVHYSGKREDTRRDSYQFIVDKTHPVVKPDSHNTELLFNAGYTALTRLAKEAKAICTWTPAINNQPPDKSWVEKFSTEFPSIVENTYGKGRVIYFANQPDVMSYTIGHPDPRNLLLRSIRYLLGNILIMESNAPSSVHIGLTASLLKPGQYILSLVNTTSGPVRPVRELIAVHDIRIKILLDGKSMNKYEVLRSQGKCSITSKGKAVEVRIGSLQDFCAIHIQMNTI